MLNKFIRLGKPVLREDEYNRANRAIKSKNIGITSMSIEKLFHVIKRS